MEEEVGAKKSKSHGNNATRWAIFKRSLRRESRKMKLLGSGFKWKRLTNLQISFLDNFLFKIVSMLEGVVLVSTLCFFFLCFGCHFWIWIPLSIFPFVSFFFFFPSMIGKNLGFDCDFLVGNSLVLCRIFKPLDWLNVLEELDRC